MNARVWWINYRDTTTRILSIVGCYASLVGVLLAVHRDAWNNWALGLGILSFLLLLVVIRLELIGKRQQIIYAKDDAAAIQDYMQRWITESGRVAIWSRDLTWANSQALRKLLRTKAQHGELVVCVPSPTALTNQLADEGAEVSIYAAGDFAPASRFTIRDFGKQGARVAVGRSQGDFHIIDEFDATTHPAFYLAQDLVELVRATEGRHVG